MAALIASFTCLYFLCSDDINHPHPAIHLCVQPYYTLQTFPGNAKPPGRRPKPEKAKKRDPSRARLAGNAARGSPGVLRKTDIICKFFQAKSASARKMARPDPYGTAVPSPLTWREIRLSAQLMQQSLGEMPGDFIPPQFVAQFCGRGVFIDHHAFNSRHFGPIHQLFGSHGIGKTGVMGSPGKNP